MRETSSPYPAAVRLRRRGRRHSEPLAERPGQPRVVDAGHRVRGHRERRRRRLVLAHERVVEIEQHSVGHAGTVEIST
jgi:hypothetical protein